MKKYVMWTLAGLMFMAPAVYALDNTTTQPAPTGPAAKGLETTQPSKETAKAQATPKKAKKKKTQSLTPDEERKMERRLEVTEPPTVDDGEVR